MKISATMFMPRNIQMRKTRYIIASITGDIVEIPGKSTKLHLKIKHKLLKNALSNGRTIFNARQLLIVSQQNVVHRNLPVAELF